MDQLGRDFARLVITLVVLVLLFCSGLIGVGIAWIVKH